MVEGCFLTTGVGFGGLGRDSNLVVSFGTGMFVLIGRVVFTGLGAVIMVF